MYSMWSMYVGYVLYVNMNVHQNCLHVCLPWWRYLLKRTLLFHLLLSVVVYFSNPNPNP